MDTVAFGTGFPWVWFYNMYFAPIKNFGKHYLKDFHLPQHTQTAPSLFPVSESTQTVPGERLGLKGLERTEVLKKKTGFFKSWKFILWVNSAERGRIKPLRTHRICEGLSVIYSHKPRCDSHLHPGHFTLFSQCKGVVKTASIIFTPTLWPFYTAKRALCVNEYSSPRGFNREEILSIDCTRPSNRVYYWDITLCRIL